MTERDAYRLGDEINELAAHISAATCRWLSLIADFDEAEAHTWFGFATCADWLAWSCGVSGPTARQHVRVARALRELGRVRECFARGELSYSKVRALSRIATPENEDYVLMLAQHCTAAQLERVVRNYRRCTATALEEANAAHANRHVYWSWDDEGYLNIRGRLTPEEGQTASRLSCDASLVRIIERDGRPSASAASAARSLPRFGARSRRAIKDAGIRAAHERALGSTATTSSTGHRRQDGTRESRPAVLPPPSPRSRAWIHRRSRRQRLHIPPAGRPGDSRRPAREARVRKPDPPPEPHPRARH